VRVRTDGAKARLAVQPPSQARGQRTLTRIVEAAERLLKQRAFEDITISDIITEAEVSTGSFYARFPAKEALLPYLYDLYNAEIDAEWKRIEAAGGLQSPNLRAAVTHFVEYSGKSVRSMRWLLKAMAIYARQHPEQIPASVKERNERFYRVVAASFTKHMKGPRADAERRARTMTYTIITLTREHALFGAAPLSAVLNADRKTFERELVRMATAYLEAA
jgi:AcrR family transcriptional regulator